MCAGVPFTSPARRSPRPDRRRHNPGRHRPGVGTIRLLADGEGGWSLAPVKRPTHYVGRVGALAVALGVGGVIVGLPGLAAADTGGSNSGASATAGVAEKSGESESKRRPRGASRTGTPDSSSASTSPAGLAGAARAGRKPTRLQRSRTIRRSRRCLIRAQRVGWARGSRSRHPARARRTAAPRQPRRTGRRPTWIPPFPSRRLPATTCPRRQWSRTRSVRRWCPTVPPRRRCRRSAS